MPKVLLSAALSALRVSWFSTASPCRTGCGLRRVLGLASLLCLTFFALSSQTLAQVSFDGVNSTNASYPNTDTISPLAVDSHGDQYYVVNNGTNNILYEIPAGGSPTVLNSTFPYSPSALAVNSSGTTLYFIYTDSGTSCNSTTYYQHVGIVSTAVNSVPDTLSQCFTFGSPTSYTGSYSSPQYLAVDSSGNLYVGDNGAAVIWQIPAPVTSSSIPTTFLNLNIQLNELAVSGGTVYFAALDFSSSNDYLYSAAASQFTANILASPASSNKLVVIPSTQNGLVADSNGNVYIGTSSGVDKYSGGSLTTVSGTSGVSVSGVGVDSAGDLFYDGTDSSSAPLVVQSGGAVVNFGSVNIGSSSNTMSLPFTIGASSSTTVTSINILTEGATGLDFADAGGSTCTATTYSSSTNCVVNVKFTPLVSGLRRGAVVFLDGSTVLSTTYIYGSGTGPQVGFAPPVQTAILTALQKAVDVAVDGSGNLYVAEYYGNDVLKETYSGGSYTASTVASGLNGPFGVAVDGAGNVYVADSGNNQVLKEALAGGTYTQSTVATGLNGPYSVAVDGSGNVYIVEYTGNDVLKETLSGGSYTQSTVASSLKSPWGVAVDGDGNVYIAEYNGNDVLKETLSGGSYTQSTVAGGLGNPQGVVVDGNGNVFISDSGTGEALKETYSGGSYTASTIATGLSDPSGIAVDGSGNVYIADSGNNRIVKEDYADAPSLSFSSTTVGSTSSDSPQTVTLENIGNAPLTFPTLASGNNPTIAANFVLDSSTSCHMPNFNSPAQSVAADASCGLAVNFEPTTSGSISGSLNVTDNNLNAGSPNYATQSISLSGTGVAPPTITLSPTTLPTATTGTAYSQTISASGGTSPYAYSLSSGSLPNGLTLNSSSGVLSGTPTQAGVFSFTVTATDANSYTGKQSYTLDVVNTLTATQVIASEVLTQNHAATPFTPVTGSGGTAPLSYSISPALPTGLSINSSTGAISGTPTVVSAATSYTVTVTDANSATATASFSLTVNTAVTATQAIASEALTQNHAATPFTPVTGSGGTAPLSYSISPALPAGLSINSSTGVITGTPTTTSPATSYTVTVTDQNGATATASFTLTVNGAVTATQAIASEALTQDHAATPFTPVTGSGGTGTLSYSVSPALPAGLSYSTSTGAITGTPTATSAATSYTVTVTDQNGATATASFTLTVNPKVTATQAIASKSLTVNTAATPFTPVTGSGGTGTLSYSVSPVLPAGLSLNSSTGAITGTPTTASAATSYTVTVTDQNGATATASFTLTVNPAVTATQAIASKSLTVNTAATPFTPVTGSGGTAPLSYSISPALPAGLSINSSTGAITGTPTVVSAVTSYTVTVTDANSATATASFSLTVNTAVTATQAIASEVLTQNHAVSPFTPVTGSGGTAPLSYSVSPTLPAGLSYNTSTGAITGIPTVVSATAGYTVTVTDQNGATATASFTLTVNSGITATAAIPSEVLTYGAAANFTPVTGSGGTGTLSYSISPALPAGLSLNSSTGAVSGTPTAVSAATNYTVTITDQNSATATAIFSLAVNQATPTVSWAPPASIPYGTALSATQLDATASYNGNPVAGAFVYSPAAGTVLSAGTHTLSVTFTPTDTTDYATPAAVTTSITVTQSTATVTLGNLTQTYTGSPLSATATTNPTGLKVALTYNGSTTPPTTVGSYTVVATINDTNYTGSATGTFTITPATPVLSWAAPASIAYGTALSGAQLDATASNNESPVAGSFVYTPPAGTVLSVGTHTLSAQFTPSDTTDYTTPAPVTTSLSVTEGTLTVTANNATRVYGTANPTFTGSVTGAANGDSFTESFSTTATQTSDVGKYAIVPSVTGADLSDYTVQITNGTLTITQAGTTTQLSASASSITPDQSLTLTAQVASSTTGTPTGSVTFFDGSTQLGVVTLSGGTASYTTTTLAAGATHSLTATYSGDVNFLASRSGTAVTVPVAALDFSLNLTGNQSQTVAPGAVASYSFQISPTYGTYPSDVNFSVSGLPPGATAVFSPSTITADGGAQKVVLTVQTAGATAKSDSSTLFKRGGATLALGFLLVPLFGVRRRKGLMRILCVTLLLLGGGAFTTLISGCGGFNGFSGQGQQSYSLTVTATSGSVVHTVVVTLNVE